MDVAPDAQSQRPPRSVGLQAVLIAGATAIAQVLVAVIYIVTARDTDPSTYGAVVTAIAVGTSAAGLVDFGSNAFWTREAASGRTPAARLGPRVSGKLILALVIAIIATAVSAVVAPVYLAAGAILISVLLGQTMLIPLRALRRGETIALLVLVERVAAVLLFALLAAVGVEPTTALWVALALGTIVLVVIAGALTPSTERMGFFTGRPRNPWAGSRHYGWSSIAASAQQLDLPLLGIVAGPAAAGLYGAVNRWTQPMQLLSGAFSSASAPFLARAEDWSHARRIILRSSWMLFAAVGVCVALAAAAPAIVPLLLGEQYDGSAEVLQWLALGTIPAIFNQPIVSALQARRFDHLVAVPWLSCVAVQLALIAILGPLLGALAAAVAFATLQVLLFAILAGCLVYAVRAEVSSAAR